MKSNHVSKIASACCSVILIAASTGAFAQTPVGNASPADKKFVKEALGGGMAEVEMGQLASQKGKSDDVKQFGQKMVEDHTKLGDQMKSVAGQIGVTPPDMLTPKDKAAKAKLQALSGDAFDKAYIKAMVADHQHDLTAFKTEASTGTSPAVKEAASQGADVVSMHLNMIKDMASKHGVMAGSSSMSGQ
jgi:putative membrane protein